MTLHPAERAQRLLDGREGWRALVRKSEEDDEIFCEVAKIGDDDAPYASVADSGDVTKPYEVGIRWPWRWDEPISVKRVSEADLERHVFAELGKAHTE